MSFNFQPGDPRAAFYQRLADDRKIKALAVLGSDRSTSTESEVDVTTSGDLATGQMYSPTKISIALPPASRLPVPLDLSLDSLDRRETAKPSPPTPPSTARTDACNSSVLDLYVSPPGVYPPPWVNFDRDDWLAQHPRQSNIFAGMDFFVQTKWKSRAQEPVCGFIVSHGGEAYSNPFDPRVTHIILASDHPDNTIWVDPNQAIERSRTSVRSQPWTFRDKDLVLDFGEVEGRDTSGWSGWRTKTLLDPRWLGDCVAARGVINMETYIVRQTFAFEGARTEAKPCTTSLTSAVESNSTGEQQSPSSQSEPKRHCTEKRYFAEETEIVPLIQKPDDDRLIRPESMRVAETPVEAIECGPIRPPSVVYDIPATPEAEQPNDSGEEHKSSCTPAVYLPSPPETEENVSERAFVSGDTAFAPPRKPNRVKQQHSTSIICNRTPETSPVTGIYTLHGLRYSFALLMPSTSKRNKLEMLITKLGGGLISALDTAIFVIVDRPPGCTMSWEDVHDTGADEETLREVERAPWRRLLSWEWVKRLEEGLMERMNEFRVKLPPRQIDN